MSSNRKRASLGGFTLVENVMACALVAVGMAGTYLVNGQSMSILRMAKDEASASQVLQQRVEHLRIANWQRITNPTWIRDYILNASADGSAALASLNETITISPYTGTSSGNTFTRVGGTASAGASNVSMMAQDALVVKWKVTWRGVPSGKVHHREMLTVLGKGGIAK
jgi:hypothetical protein